MKNLLGFYQVSERVAWIWTKRSALATFGEGTRSIMHSNQVKRVTIPDVNIPEVRVANTGDILQHRCEHWLKIAGRA
jgi:hypothetical protein